VVVNAVGAREAGCAGWPDPEWLDALDELSAIWRGGVPAVRRWLFHGTGLSAARSISRSGLRPTEGLAGPSAHGRDALARRFVHLATPEVAAWYMADTAVHREAAPALVAVDLSAWDKAACAAGAPPLLPLADANSLWWPTLSALGVPGFSAIPCP